MITVDGINYSINSKNQITIYQFLYSKGIVIPCFCYHEKLSIAGNCRMCLIEANNALVVSCAMPLLDKMNIITKSQRLLHARENILEFLLANHPLDCPVCDQGGECDLQDLSKTFGLDRGRFYEFKRSVDNLNCFGPLIKTIMTRCIHCTRCVRFLNEYSDIESLGMIDRGSAMKINNYKDILILDELCGNIIDLCPVGALTSMQYAFSARPWELRSIESIDVLDAVASTIRIDVISNQIIRVLPVLTESLNEDWLTNKARFSYDAVNQQRLVEPMVRKDGKWESISWLNACKLIANKLKDNAENITSLTAKVGDFLDLETAWGLKLLFNSIGCNDIQYKDQLYNFNVDHRAFYLLNIKLPDIEILDLVILIGLNPRIENPLLNSRLRKNYNNRLKKNQLLTFSIGQSLNYSTFPIINIGNDTKNIKKLCEWRCYQFKKAWFTGFNSASMLGIYIPKYTKPIILIGTSILERPDSKGILSSLYRFSLDLEKYIPNIDYPVFNIVSNSLGKLSAFETGLFSYTGSKDKEYSKDSKSMRINYLINVEPINTKKSSLDFTIYQGPYFYANSTNDADLLLPTASHVEKVATFINLEGRIRSTKIAIPAEYSVLTDLEVFIFLQSVLRAEVKDNFTKKKSSQQEEVNISEIDEKASIINSYEEFQKSFIEHHGFGLQTTHKDMYLSKENIKNIRNCEEILGKPIFSKGILHRQNNNYYNSDSYIKNSATMALCASQIKISNFSEKK